VSTIRREGRTALEKARQANQRVQAFLAAVEPGELMEPAFKEVRESAKLLRKIANDQRRVTIWLEERRVSRFGPLEKLLGPGK
jgi:hypothetical protein